MTSYYLKRLAVSLVFFAALVAIIVFVAFSYVLHIPDQKATGLGIVVGGIAPLIVVGGLIVATLGAVSTWISSKLIKKPQ